jgi:hypothetical protein
MTRSEEFDRIHFRAPAVFHNHTGFSGAFRMVAIGIRLIFI